MRGSGNRGLQRASENILECDDSHGRDVHDPSPTRKSTASGSRTGPYERIVDPRARTRTRKKQSDTSDSNSGLQGKCVLNEAHRRCRVVRRGTRSGR